MPGELRQRKFLNDTYIVTHHVDDAHDGWRTDHFLKARYRNRSRAVLQKAIDGGSITLSQRSRGETPRLKASTVLRTGDVLNVTTEPKGNEPRVDFNYKVLFEDDHILVIDKPGNLPVHPAGRFFFNTLLMQLRSDRAEHLQSGQDFYMVHRIDRETSGIILMAKSSPMARELVRQFFEHEVAKKYFAVVVGQSSQKEFTIDRPITNAQNSAIRLKMAVCEPGSGLPASTHIRVLQQDPEYALVLASPRTGRQHQIRVHLASEGLPLAGDKLYGPSDEAFLAQLYDWPEKEKLLQKLPLPRQALHSCYLKFTHPHTREPLEIFSELPEDMAQLLRPLPSLRTAILAADITRNVL